MKLEQRDSYLEHSEVKYEARLIIIDEANEITIIDADTFYK